LRLVGHRGAAGLAPENTIKAIKAGIKAGVDAIEFDIRITKDKKLVVCHDDSLERTCGIDKKVAELKLVELEQIKVKEGEFLPSLESAVEAAGDTPLFIEGKGTEWARPLARFIKKHNLQVQSTVISYNHRELYTFGQYCKNVPRYAVEHHNPFDAINAARIFGLEGVDMNYWILNPLAYWLAQRHKLDIAVYTVNKPWIASFLRVFYPQIAVTTNYPNHMQFIRPKQLRISRRKTSSKV
jgi:glycerophosphoryl diester phosphodiesterase